MQPNVVKNLSAYGDYKVGLIGYGYWGKIIEKNLKTLGINPTIYDICGIGIWEDIVKCSHVFVVTPVNNHFLYCDLLLSKGTNVFCEKPLSYDLDSSKFLFDRIQDSNSYLFVDWIFLFNEYVRYIKTFTEENKLGRLKSITMNRLNLGPSRDDVPARLDLASHDVSILNFLLGYPSEIHWIDYNRGKYTQFDSCIGLLRYGDVFAQINASWHYGKKDRTCIFEYEQGFLIWDDIENSIKINGNEIEVKSGSPLINSITAFLAQSIPQEEIKTTTLAIEKVLYENYLTW